MVLEDGKWPVRLPERDVATGIWVVIGTGGWKAASEVTGA